MTTKATAALRRPRIKYDEDGGITVHDVQSDVVLSIIGTHPDSNEPKGLIVEAYAYSIGKTVVHRLLNGGRRPTFVLYTEPRASFDPDKEQ